MTRLLSVTAAAAQFDCSRGHVYGLIAAGQLWAVDIKPSSSTRTKTRVREDDLDAYIEAMTRGNLTGAVARAAARSSAPGPRGCRNLERPVYTTPEAAAYAEVHVETVAVACRDGRLHGTRATPRGRWRIEQPCLAAWIDTRPCPHQDGGDAGEDRRGDGT